MRILRVVLVSVSLAALAAACGGKNKKQDTTGADGTSTGTSTATDTSSSSTDTSGAGATDPNLQEIVYFEFDSFNLDEAGRAKLQENAAWLKADPQRTLTIEGHTDEVGTPEYNLALGEKRAQASREYLLDLGIEANRVSIITYGEEKTAGDDDAQNRRSVFVATKKK